MKKLNIALIATFLLTISMAAPVTAGKPLSVLTMDEIPNQPIDGLRYGGVTFSFHVNGIPSTDAHYHAFGPLQLLYLDDPSIEGTASGTVVIEFDKPTTVIEFGVALNVWRHLRDAVIIKLYRPGVGLLRETIDLDAHPEIFWAEALYQYFGPAVKTVEISFRTDLFNPRFALDNLTFHKHPRR
jgi:hypothetical protein